MRRYEITDQQWTKNIALLPGKVGDVGLSAIDNRLFINAVLWIARSGAPWRDLPERFGPWNSVYRRFRRWAKIGVWQTIFEHLSGARLRLAKDRLDARSRSSTRSNLVARLKVTRFYLAALGIFFYPWVILARNSDKP